MTTFTAYFRADASIATLEIKARSPKLALAGARAIAADGSADLTFENCSLELVVDEIEIRDGDKEVAIWFGSERRVRPTAEALLAAGRKVVDRWERGDLAEAVRELAAVIARVEGGAA